MLDNETLDELSLTLELGLARASEWLTAFAETEDAESQIGAIFGDAIDFQSLLADWRQGEMGFYGVVITGADALSGNAGAYVADTDTIYVSDDLIFSLDIDRIAILLPRSRPGDYTRSYSNHI